MLPAPVAGRHWLSETDTAPTATWPSVRWSLSFVALLAYLAVIVTYQFTIGTFVIGAGLAGLVIEPKGIRIPLFWILLLGMLVWGAIGYLSSPWPALVYEPLEVLWKLTLIALVAVSVLNDRGRIRVFMLAFVLFYALYPARGALFNFFLGGYTIYGRAVWNFIYRNPNDLGALTLLLLSMAAGLLVTERNKLTRYAAMVAVPVLALLVLLTGSRGAFLGLFVFGVLALSGERRKARLFGVLGAVGLAAVLLLPQSTWDRFGMLGDLGRGGTAAFEELEDQGSAEQRFEIWRTAVRIIGDYPFVGVGLGAYNAANEQYSPHLGRRDTHSTYLRITAEMGFPGLLLFLGMIASAVVPAERVRRRLKRIRPHSARQLYLLELGLLAFLVAGVFASYGKLTFLYLHLALIWALATAQAAELRRAQRADLPRSRR